MKKIFLTLAAIAITYGVQAENNILGVFNLGIKGGITSTSAELPKSGDALKEAATAKGNGLFAAAFLRVNVLNKSLKVFIQPEFQYTRNTYQIPTAGQIIGTEAKEEVEEVNLVDVPLLLGADLGLGSLVRVRANAGPVFAISDNKKLKELKGSDFERIYKDPSISWTAGIGVSVLSFLVDLRYNGNFADGKVSAENVDLNQRSSWNLSVGIMF